MAPIILTPSPGPGNGCRLIRERGIFKLMPSFLTSSLNKSFIGSNNLNLIFFGNPPTLWCDFIVFDLLFTADSIISG